jgi:DNA-binding XRE family transcriptional regulator
MDILRTLRKRKGYTVQQAADLIGVTRVTLHTWEGGQKAPKAPALQ